MKPARLAAGFALALVGACGAPSTTQPHDVDAGTPAVSDGEGFFWALPDARGSGDDAEPAALAGALVRDARVVYVGEAHDEPSHHLAQRAVIEYARSLGRPVVIAAEMFPWSTSATTATYSDGGLSTAAFVEAIAWDDVWGFDWALYAPVFELAREPDVRLVGINAPDGASRAVFERGRDGVDGAIDAGLPVGEDTIDPEYRAFLAEALTAHGMPSDDPSFEETLDRFVEAQRVWDRSMGGAVAALDAALPPDTVIVVIAGGGHIAGPGRIPDVVRQLRPDIDDAVFSCIRDGEPHPIARDVDVVCVTSPPAP